MAARFGGLNWQLRPDSNRRQMALRKDRQENVSHSVFVLPIRH